MVNLAGQVLKSYEVQERIGVGGFGAVFRANQPSIGREVAVKMILPEHANKADFVKRFETEAQLVARLEHPHIVPLYDYWREPGGAYLVMRYLKGGSLRDSLEENGPWTPSQVTRMLLQVGSALAFAHASGVVHRDLKTDNILLDETGNCYLTDFGIAKDLGVKDNLTKDAILGTPAYLSPEQIRGELASYKSDIYSLGILIFEALTASKPFYDATPATVLYKQLNEPLPSLSKFRDDAPPELDIVLQRATSKDSDLRYDNVLALVRDFAAAVNENVADAPPTGSATLDVLSITQEEEALINAVNPYKGLRAFQSVDSEDFFGRDELIQELLEHLSTEGKNKDFLAVVGPSGSGKSSVVKAGMIPRIDAGVLDEEVDWFTAEMVPGTHPMEELEVALLAVATHEIPDLFEILTRDERGLVRAVKRIIPENSEFVLLIDQFEETFTLIEDNDERIHFLHSILNAVEDERSRVKIIVTLRADFYDRPLLYADFGNLVRKNTELVLPFTRKELEAAIIGPADRVKITLEAGLVNAIISDVFERPGALPLLQYALTELFERREGRAMKLAAYQDIGGTTGALARRAEELYQDFSDEEKDAARQMFLRLVTLGEGTDDTRRRVFQSELLSLNRASDAMPKVIEQFGKYRLLTFDHDPQTRSSTIEVAHEAIIRRWERVRGWLDENRESLRLHRRLTSATEEWNQGRRDAGFLARGVRLEQFESLAESGSIDLNETEKIFIQMSVEARTERDRIELERQQREEELEARARQRLQLLASVMAIAAIIGVGLAAFAIIQQQRAEEQKIIAEENAQTAIAAEGEVRTALDELATSEAIQIERANEARALALAANARNAESLGDPQLALVLALEAEHAYSPVPIEIIRTMSNVIYAPGPREKFNNHTGSVTGVDFSADSQLMISSSTDGTVRVIDVTTLEETLVVSIDEGWFYNAAIHPDRTSIAAAGSDGIVYVWSYPDGALLYQLDGHSDEVMTVDYSPDGTILASGSVDHNIILWASSDGSQIRTLEGHTGVVLNVVFSPDGTRLASSSADETLGQNEEIQDRTVRIWDIAGDTDTVIIDPESGFVRALDFSPAGDTVTYGVYDGTYSGTVRVHNVETGEEIQRFAAHTTPVTAVAYNADGTQVASVAWDRTVRIWDIELGFEVGSFVGFGDRVLSMAFSPDGASLAMGIGNVGNNIYYGNDGSVDQTLWLWDMRNGQQIDAFTGHPDWQWTVDLSHDGMLAVTGGGPLNLPVDLEENADAEAALLASTTVLVWNVETLEIVATLPAHTNTVDSVRFHPDGERVLTSSWDSQIILWDIATESQIRSYENGHEGAVYMLRFLNDGANFVSVGSDGKAIMWDTETGDIVQIYEHQIPGGEDGSEMVNIRVNGLDFSRDETQMATTTGNWGVSNGNLVWLWDLETGEVLQQFEGHGHIVNEVRFHPSGLYMVSSSWDGKLRVWNPTTGDEVRQFTGHASETFGIDFSEDGRVMLTTSSDRTVRMWDWATGEEMQRFTEHNDWVQEVIFSYDDSFAISAGQDPAARIWRINRDALSLRTFAEENRYIRDLSCSERDVYRLEQLERCED